MDVAGLRCRPRTVRRPAAVALAGSVRSDAPGRCPAPGTQQRWPAAGAVRTGTVAAPYRSGAEGVRTPLVAVAAMWPGDRRWRAGAAQPPAPAGRAGPAVLAAVRPVRWRAGVPVGLQHPLRRMGQPQPAAAFATGRAAAAGRDRTAAPARAGTHVQDRAVAAGGTGGGRAGAALAEPAGAVQRAVDRAAAAGARGTGVGAGASSSLVETRP